MSVDFTNDLPDGDSMNVANTNASALILIPKLPDSGYLDGECGVAIVRAAILRALNQDGYLKSFVRSPVIEERLIEFGIDEAYLRDRLEHLQRIVTQQGATVLRWV